MKRKILFIVLFLTFCLNAFSEIRWLDAKDNDQGITAYAACSTEEEVLQITHWKDLSSHFMSYSKETEVAKQDMYLVIFMNLGTIVYEYHKGTKIAGYYVKTIFE